MFEVRRGSIPDLLIITTQWHGDERGEFSESYQEQRFRQAGVTARFLQDNHVISRKAGTLRGMHFQKPPRAQGKLLRVLRGAIFDVAVDVRPGSPSYGRWEGITLSAENRLQFYVPPGFAHGYLTLTDECEVLYKVDAPYARETEGGIWWNDPEIGIAWPMRRESILIAPRDDAMRPLAELAPIEDWRIGEKP